MLGRGNLFFWSTTPNNVFVSHILPTEQYNINFRGKRYNKVMVKTCNQKTESLISCYVAIPITLLFNNALINFKERKLLVKVFF